MEYYISKDLSWFRNRMRLLQNDRILIETKSIYSKIKSLSKNCDLYIRQERNWSRIQWIIIDDNEEYIFSSISGESLHYQFTSYRRIYDIIGESERKFSIFEKKNRLVSYERADNWFSGQKKYRLNCNDDVNISLIFLMVLFIDFLFEDDGKVFI